MRSPTLRSALTLLVALGFASTASATVMVEVPLDDMIRSADAIVHGTVVSSNVRVELRPDGTLEPQTITTIRVREWIAGDGGETVQLRELGGAWQGRVVHYDGTPQYAPGEEVIVFLERRPDAPHDLRTLAMVQGKFAVRHGVPGVPSSVSRDLSGIAFYRWAGGQTQITPGGVDPAVELTIFLEHLRRVRGAR